LARSPPSRKASAASSCRRGCNAGTPTRRALSAR
jgi:hypothetical protein